MKTGSRLPVLLCGTLLILTVPLGIPVGAGEAVALPESTGADAFVLNNDESCRRLFDLVWATKPILPVHPEQLFTWLEEMAIRAGRMRWNRLAEAGHRAVTGRWPHSAMAWANLSAVVGKQGRFQEALEFIERAGKTPGVNRAHVENLRATWLWRLGRKDEAAVVIEDCGRPPKDQPDNEATWLACRAFYHAVTDGDEIAIQRLIGDSLKIPDNDHWLYFIKRDPAFDRYRHKDWFRRLLGETAKGQSLELAFTNPPHLAIEDEFIAQLPMVGSDAVGRQAFADAAKAIGAEQWDEALQQVARGKASLPVLPELFVVEALAHAGKDEYPQAMDAIREISHRGFRLYTSTVDAWTLSPLSQNVVSLLLAAGRRDPTKGRRVALALIIHAHFEMEYGGYAQVVQAMDAAESWCPGLPEIANTRGIAQEAQKAYAKAAQDYLKALTLAPRFADPALNLGHLCFDRQEPAMAKQWIDRALASGTDYPLLHMEHALVTAANGQIEAGIAEMDRLAAAETPAHRALFGMYWELSSSCGMQRRFPEAERMTRKAIALDPNRSDTWTKLSGDLGRQGRYQDALAATQMALDMGPADAVDGTLAKATWLQLLGRGDEARALVAQVQKPASEYALMLYLGGRALFAAAAKDEAMLRDDLAKLLGADADGRRLMWIKTEPFLDPYRGLEWFKAMIPPDQAKERRSDAADQEPRF